MNPLQELKRIVKGDNNEDELIETFYVLMKTFGYTLDELKKIPIPTFNLLVRMINKEEQLNRKAIRKR